METVQKKPVYKRWWFWVLAAFILMVIASSGSSGGTEDGQVSATLPEEKEDEIVVDAPHLLELTIEEARIELGEPDDQLVDPNEQQLALGTTEWSNEFTVNGYSILLTYNVESREINDFFISANDDPDRGTKDWKKLVSISNLSESSDSYTVDPIESRKDAGYYTGVEAKENAAN